MVVGYTQGQTDGCLTCSDGGDGDGHDHARHVIQVRGGKEEVQVAAGTRVKEQHTRLKANCCETCIELGKHETVE